MKCGAIEGLGRCDTGTLNGTLPGVKEGFVKYIVEYKGAISEEGKGFV